MVELIGHRGARSLYPENTLAGFRAAIADGVLWFEIDVGMTRDGVVVLSHDPALSPELARRRHAGTWIDDPLPLIQLTYAEVERFDVGRARPGGEVAKRFPHQHPKDGEGVPTLAQALALDRRVRWTIEIKTYPNRPRLTAAPERIAEAVAAEADKAGAADRIVVQSFDWRGPRHLRRLRPDLSYAWLTTRRTRAWRGGQWALPGSVVAERGGTWSPRHDELTPGLMRRAHGHGLRVVPWTVNDTADVRRLAAWGVDAIITDNPLAAAAALAGDVAVGPARSPHPARR